MIFHIGHIRNRGWMILYGSFYFIENYGRWVIFVLLITELGDYSIDFKVF